MSTVRITSHNIYRIKQCVLMTGNVRIAKDVRTHSGLINSQ